MVLKIICPRCNCSMSIEAKNIIKKDSLSCINCELLFPQESFIHLKTSMYEFLEAQNQDVSYDDTFAIHTVGASFSIEPVVKVD